MKSLLAVLLPAIAFAAAPTALFAQSAAAQAQAKPSAKPAAKPAAKPPAARKLTAEQQKQLEAATPLEEPDPTVKLSDADLAVAKKVYVGDIPCELGATVKVTAMKRDGFFFVVTGKNRFVMHPVESRTGAVRLEDPVRGALWLQLGNKSMLMSQKLGQRLADECQSADQVKFAEELKKNPINLLEPAPAAAAAASAASAPGKAGPN